MRSRRTRLAVLLALLPLLGACATSRPQLGDPLPFHVALMPVEIHDTTRATARAEPGQEGGSDGLRLALDASAVSETLREELAHAFVRATLLAPPADAARLEGVAAAERDQYWQERAREVGADLLMRTRLQYDPAIDGERNEKFWLNLPLFLLGGPMCYFVGDRSYSVSARLQAEVFDATEGHTVLGDFALLPIPLYVEAGEQDLRFIDRASGAGDYALSLIVPAGLLAKESSEVEAELETRLPRELARDLVVKVFDERGQFEQNPTLGAFRVDARGARIEPAAAGRTRVELPVQDLGGSGHLRYELRAGSELLARHELTGESGGVHLIEGEFDLPEGTEFLNVRVTDGKANVRSYTVRVAPRDEPRR